MDESSFAGERNAFYVRQPAGQEGCETRGGIVVLLGDEHNDSLQWLKRGPYIAVEQIPRFFSVVESVYQKILI